MIVYVLFHETNSGHCGDESDGYVDAVYATEALAEAAKDRAIRAADAEGRDVYWHPDRPDEEGPTDWTDDWRVEAHEVIEDVDDLGNPEPHDLNEEPRQVTEAEADSEDQP